MTELIFVDHGVKVNCQYYSDVLLYQQMITCCVCLSQDSSLAHRARDTIQLLQWEKPDFIGPDLCPPNSPDLNPIDYKIKGVVQQQVYNIV